MDLANDVYMLDGCASVATVGKYYNYYALKVFMGRYGISAEPACEKVLCTQGLARPQHLLRRPATGNRALQPSTNFFVFEFRIRIRLWLSTT